MMYTMPKNLLSICVNFALATQRQYHIIQLRRFTEIALAVLCGTASLFVLLKLFTA